MLLKVPLLSCDVANESIDTIQRFIALLGSRHHARETDTSTISYLVKPILSELLLLSMPPRADYCSNHGNWNQLQYQHQPHHLCVTDVLFKLWSNAATPGTSAPLLNLDNKGLSYQNRLYQTTLKLMKNLIFASLLSLTSFNQFHAFMLLLIAPSFLFNHPFINHPLRVSRW